ncbi:MAG: DIP1984 family protein [Clostridia bacterium]|nr:DIP1984 family protein [Clostridia bacterium]
MKLAEALINRADAQKRLAALETRLINNARVQEGEKPAEDPTELLKELSALTQQIEDLLIRINLTNSRTVDQGDTLTALLSRRDAKGEELRILKNFLETASSLTHRSTRSEIRIVSTVNVAQLQKQADHLAAELRGLDVRIQALNWTTELIE